MKQQTFDTKNTNNYPKLLTYILQYLGFLNSKIDNLGNGSTPPTPSLDEVTTVDNNILEKDIIINSAGDDKGVTLYRDAFNNTRITKSRIYSLISGVLYQYVFPQTSGELVTDVPNNNGIYTRKYRQWIAIPKTYTVLISQTGIDAPVVTSALENTTGGTVTYSYNGPGEYEGTCVGFTIPVDKFVPIPFISAMDDLIISMERLTDTTFRIFVTDFLRVGTDELIYGVQPLSFKVYN